MQDKINQFLKLQEIDTEIAEFEKSFEDLPKEISSLEKKIDFENIKISNLKEKINELEKEMKNYNNEIDSIDNKISEQEEKLFSINSTKEFEALQKETGDLKRLKLEIEDSQIKTMESADSSKKALAEMEEFFTNDIEPLKNQIETLKSKLKEYTDKKSKLSIERDSKTKSLDQDFLTKYESLMVDNPPVIVPAIGETCSFCCLTIPPHTYIKVLQKTEIINCPHCRKILIPEENLNE